MRFLKYILITIVWLGFEQITLSQYYLKLQSDSISLECDSVLLYVDEYRGTIEWQASTDLINWVPLNEIKDTLGVRIDSTAYYRATITEGTCNLVMSDTVKIIEKITETTSNQFTVNSLGGVFLLPAGVKIKIPPGAVNESVTIDVYMLDSLTAREEIPFVRDSGKYFLNSLRFKPEGIRFQKPIKIKVPAYEYKYSSLPMVHFLNTAGDEWKEYNGYLLCSQKDNFIELVTDSLSSILIDAYPDVFDSPDKLKSTTADCREGLIKINSKSHDLSKILRSTECYVYQDEGSVEFLECTDLPPAYWKIREISRNCVPKIDILINGNLNKSMIKVGEETELIFFTHIYSIPLEKQFVNVVLPAGFLENSLSGYTGEDGKITFQINPESENLNGEIAYVADFEYCLQLIEATANGMSESACQIKPLKQVLIEDSTQIIIYDDCTDPDEIDCNLINNTNCQTIKNQLIDTIEFKKENIILKVDESENINVIAYNIEGTELTTPNIYWSTADSLIATIDNSGTVTGISAGKTQITGTWCENNTITIEVEIKCTFIDERDGQEYNCVKIGEQTWMAENLNYSGNESSYYGRLYTYSRACNACPSGWHLPSDDEWKQLEIYLGMPVIEANAFDWDGDIPGAGSPDESRGYYAKVGSKLKAASGWDGTNESGFTALPGGMWEVPDPIYGGGGYHSQGVAGFWWSSTRYETDQAVDRELDTGSPGVFRDREYKDSRESVRCVKD